MRLVEWLCASALFLVGVLAVAPLSTRARADLRTSELRSKAAALAQDHLELQRRRATAEEITETHYWGLDARGWLDEESPPGTAVWRRRTRSTTYSLLALADGHLERVESFDSGGTPEALRHVTVRVEHLNLRDVVAEVSMLVWIEP